jgi:hypothetical protein
METIFPVQSITMVSRVGGVMENLIVNYKAGGLEGIQMVPLVVIADGSTEERDGGGNVVVETQAVACAGYTYRARRFIILYVTRCICQTRVVLIALMLDRPHAAMRYQWLKQNRPPYQFNACVEPYTSS